MGEHKATFSSICSRSSDVFVQILLVLLPSFVSNRFKRRDDASSIPERIRPTAWLDGLRGWAALFVFFYHFNMNYHWWNGDTYGWRGLRVVFTLPIIRTCIAGPGMVSLFFVVSGYSLSLAPMKELHYGVMVKFYRKLASSTLRRSVRLFAPQLISSFVVFIWIRLGFYNYSISKYEGWKAAGFEAQLPPVFDSTWDQFKHWFQTESFQMFTLSFDEAHSSRFWYIPPGWTIRVEFQCSMVLFLVTMAGSVLRYWPRFILNCLMLGYCIWYGTWAVILFMCGYILADYSLTRDGVDTPEPKPTIEPRGTYIALISPRSSSEATEVEDICLDEEKQEILVEEAEVEEVVRPKTSYYRKYCIPIIFLVALHLVSAPEMNQYEHPLYAGIGRILIPSWWSAGPRIRCLSVYGAVLIVYCVSLNKPLQSFFGNSFSRYLGRISFSLYLWHVPVSYTLGFTVIPNLWKITNGWQQVPISQLPAGEEVDVARRFSGGTPFGYELGVFLGFLLVNAASVWMADIFTRLVDEPIVKLTKKIENMSAQEF